MTTSMSFAQPWLADLKTVIISQLIPFIVCDFTTEEIIPNSSYTGRSHEEIEKIFKKHEIIPDLIDEAPEYELSLRYVGGIFPDFGTKHTPDELRYTPFALRFPTEKHVLYSLFMLDLDSPSRQNATKRAYYHWGLANLLKYKILHAETLAKYLAPFPEKGTGEHRYVFLIYKQPFGKVLYMEPRLLHLPDDTHRARFDIRAIVKKYKLIGPIAGNFLYCKWHPPAENPYMGHAIISHDENEKKPQGRRGSRGNRTTTPPSTTLPADELEEDDVEGTEPA